MEEKHSFDLFGWLVVIWFHCCNTVCRKNLKVRNIKYQHKWYLLRNTVMEEIITFCPHKLCIIVTTKYPPYALAISTYTNMNACSTHSVMCASWNHIEIYTCPPYTLCSVLYSIKATINKASKTPSFSHLRQLWYAMIMCLIMLLFWNIVVIPLLLRYLLVHCLLLWLV